MERLALVVGGELGVDPFYGQELAEPHVLLA
jgi:hypothetical protein